MDHTKIDTAYFDSPRQDFSNGGLQIVVVLLVCSGIIFLCIYTRGPIQLYNLSPNFTHFVLDSRNIM